MKLKVISVTAGILAIAITLWLTLVPRHRLQPTIFIFTIPNSAESELRKFALGNCPRPALVGEDDADYGIYAVWGKNNWTVSVIRKNQSTVYEKSDGNYKRLIRQACDAADQDFPVWLDTEHKRRQALSTGDQDVGKEKNVGLRYELHEMRNGSLTSTALVDRQTGKVWVWTEMTDAKGRKAGDRLIQVEVSPPPDKE